MPRAAPWTTARICGGWLSTISRYESPSRVLQRHHCPARNSSPGTSLDEVLAREWGTVADAVDWRERLKAQLRDGSFHYVTVAQRFTPPVLRTLRYLNATMTSRFSAVELVRFTGQDHAAFEARFVAGAELPKSSTGSGEDALAGVEELCAAITDDDYRHHLQDLFDAFAAFDGLKVFWDHAHCEWPCPTGDRCPSAGYPPDHRGGSASRT